MWGLQRLLTVVLLMRNQPRPHKPMQAERSSEISLSLMQACSFRMMWNLCWWRPCCPSSSVYPTARTLLLPTWPSWYASPWLYAISRCKHARNELAQGIFLKATSVLPVHQKGLLHAARRCQADA